MQDALAITSTQLTALNTLSKFQEILKVSHTCSGTKKQEISPPDQQISMLFTLGGVLIFAMIFHFPATKSPQ